MLGQDIVAFIDTLNKADIFSIGINCVAIATPHPDQRSEIVPSITPLIRRLASFGTRVSLYPNAGLPDANGHYGKSPESFAADLWPLLEGHYLNIIGGCCGTTDAHIACIAKAVEPIPGLRLSPLTPQTSDKTSPIRHQTSPIRHQTSPIRHQTSLPLSSTARATTLPPPPVKPSPGASPHKTSSTDR